MAALVSSAPIRPVRLRVIASSRTRFESWLVDLYLQIVVLVRVVRRWRIERNRIGGLGIFQTAGSFFHKIIARAWKGDTSAKPDDWQPRLESGLRLFNA